MTRLREVSREDLLERRRTLLERLGTTHEELARRAEHGSLIGEEWAVWDELREIAFLLGDDDPGR